jgi:selenocysteine lyase/cysteine desulfurase
VNVDEVRNQIPLLKNTVYLDNAGAGPPPASVHAAMQYFLDEWRDYGGKWESWLLDIVKFRDLFAQLIWASLDEVACIPNVSSGLEEHVVVAPRVNTLRVSPHFYNTKDEIDRLLEKV